MNDISPKFSNLSSHHRLGAVAHDRQTLADNLVCPATYLYIAAHMLDLMEMSGRVLLKPSPKGRTEPQALVGLPFLRRHKSPCPPSMGWQGAVGAVKSSLYAGLQVGSVQRIVGLKIRRQNRQNCPGTREAQQCRYNKNCVCACSMMDMACIVDVCYTCTCGARRRPCPCLLLPIPLHP